MGNGHRNWGKKNSGLKDTKLLWCDVLLMPQTACLIVYKVSGDLKTTLVQLCAGHFWILLNCNGVLSQVYTADRKF